MCTGDLHWYLTKHFVAVYTILFLTLRWLIENERRKVYEQLNVSRAETEPKRTGFGTTRRSLKLYLELKSTLKSLLKKISENSKLNQNLCNHLY